MPAHSARHKGSEQARVRATELAQAAQINYREWGNKPESQLEAVTKWLAAPKNKPPVLAALGFGEGVPASSLPAHGKGSPPASPGQPPLPAADVLAPEPPAAASAPPPAPTSPAEE